MKRSAILIKIRDLNYFSDQEEDKIRYAWLSIRNDLFKIIILWVVAAILGYMKMGLPMRLMDFQTHSQAVKP